MIPTLLQQASAQLAPGATWYLASGTRVFIVVVFMIVSIIALAIHAKKKAEQRRQALRAWATERGYSFSAAHDSSIDNRFAQFDALRQGNDRYGYNIAHGTWKDHELWAFDYHYETTSTDGKGRQQTHHHHFSAVVLHTPYALKPLNIRNEGFFDRVSEFFGANDIDFESAEFSREFHVKAPDKRWAYDVINTRTMELLLGARRHKIAMAGPHVMLWTGKRFGPAAFDGAVRLGLELVEGIPADIRESLRYDRAT